MNKKIIVISILIVAVLFVSAMAGTIFYYNGVVNDRNSKIDLLNAQIANLEGQITNLTSANIETTLGITEYPSVISADLPRSVIYNHLEITGSVNNTGRGTAYNAGLHVVGYDANSTLLVNMTVPFMGAYGTDAQIDSYFSSNFSGSSLQLGSLYSGQTATIDVIIYREGTVSNWNVTPVWTNSP
ncbi:MAG: hypothetical protein ABSB71_03245 [Candidatus Bathyarchaeia archaeon]|jgi:hypothetical protein